MYGNNSQQQGFSLLEVLIAVLILSVGLLGLASMQVANLKVVHNSSQKQQATLLLNDLAARIRNNFTGAKAGNYETPAPLTDCGTAPANTCQSESCNPSEIAALDLAQIMCGDGSGSIGVRNSLTNGQLSITCPAGCGQGLNLSIQWQERIITKNNKGTTDVAETSEFQPFDLSLQIMVRNF
ncbi:type IV pilus modification protein PilV [Thiofilum flexile]|uniref:type IV pilus modification protein PilV n=1 Tax=Thiofilum flexile TaxID=125627 RepID=UPI00036A9BF3|nr:type IV pilus modification protein PilV [Thiofilum flexile]